MTNELGGHLDEWFSVEKITGLFLVLIYSAIKMNPLQTSGRHLMPLARRLAFKQSYLTIFVDLLFGISFELVSKRLLL